MATTNIIKDTFVINLTSSVKKPFNENDLKKHFARIKFPAEVTSIPSPFAPMHLFNMAFFAAIAYEQENKANLYIEGTGEYLYDKLISHNLDIFELLFYWDELHLAQRGFSIESFSVPSVDMLKEKSKSSGEDKEKHLNFRTTLDLYIDRYKSKLNLKDESGNDTKDAFDCGYHIKYKEEIIAETSPLTGFFISASTNFGQDGISGIWQNDKSIVYLADDKKTFRPIAKRMNDLRVFLCKLINTDVFCPRSYTYFKDYVKGYAKDFEKTDEYKKSTLDLSKFGFDPERSHLDLINGAVINPDKKNGKEKTNEENIIVIPDRYNKIYFRSLIDVKKGVRFNLNVDDYKENLDERMLLGQKTKWLSVDDFFQNDIIELDDAINTERFYCCKVTDQNGKDSEVKALLPLKERFFEFFNFDKDNAKAENQLVERIEVNMVDKDKYVATLKTPTKIGEVILVKEYLHSAEKTKSNIVRLADDEDSLYMGIYPFVKDSVNKENNGFFRIFTYHSTKLSSELKFYKDTNKGLELIEDKDRERHIVRKSYRRDFEQFPISTFYALERLYFDKDNAFRLSSAKDVDFELIEVILTKNSQTYEALLIPKFIQRRCERKSGMLSVDFGTSNTNISIGTDGSAKKVSDYNSYISDEYSKSISQVVMLHKPKGDKFDFEASRYGATNQNHFLSEFMPAIISKDHDHYKFALPSVINLHEDKMESTSVSLVHANIPVAYYSKGLRKMKDKEIDKPFANFKWTGNDKQKELYVYLFIDQLLLMARNLLLADEQNPKDAVVIYSMPLSMKDTELNFYRGLWNALAKKYFNEENLHNISESRAPYYASGKEFGADSTILLDVGGGSTDILFYLKEKVVATTSYAYAANALFAGASKENIFMRQMPPKASDEKEPGMNEVEENATMSVCDIFNYRFAKKEYLVKTQFLASDEWQYLLTLHCSALLFHAIQNNKVINGNEIPLKNILFSGNGAKLFKLLNGIDADNDKLIRLAKNIDKYVYGKNESLLKISFVDEDWVDTRQQITLDSTVGMKAATSIGSICWQMNLKGDRGQNTDPKVIPIGDAVSLLKTGDLTNDAKREEWNAEDPARQKDIITKVHENFVHFMNGFLSKENETGNTLFDCGLRTFVTNPIDKKEVWKIINEDDFINTSIADYHVKYPIPEHSIFFVPVQKLIIELSKLFVKKINQ